jgi:hypothetical protein
MTNKDTLKERVRQFMTDFDIGQRLFLNGKLHSTTWNKEVEAKLYTLIEQERQAERLRSAKIVEEMMEDTEYWQPIAGRILERVVIKKGDLQSLSTPQEVTGNKE